MLINSPQDMLEFGKEISKKHRHVLLHGDLGAGKTMFTKGFANGLGIDSDIVQSPTFTYLNIYKDKLLHIDMYRLENFDDIVTKGIISHIGDFDFIVVEWPKYIEKLPLENSVSIQIKKIDEDTREIFFL